MCLPATLLASGLCLVDTPGIGSAFSGNTEATRAFVPHIDAALVVVGADPPISGDELALVVDVLTQVPSALFVINKADRLPAEDLRQAREFTERLISDRLDRSIGPVLEVSAAERVERGVPTRDWQQLENALLALAGNSGEILRASHRRGCARLAKRLRDDLDERHGALVRPVQESEARIDVLRRSVAEAEAMLRELGILLADQQRQLLKAFQEQQGQFVDPELVSALEELHAWIDRLPTGHLRDRARAFDWASKIVQRRVSGWLTRFEPEADVLYGRATGRFTALANQFLSRLAETGDPAFATLPRSLEPEMGLREERHYYQTSLMHLTAPGWLNRLADVLLPRSARLARVTRDTDAYLERLLRSNTTRVVFDLEHRVEVSRRQLESELRFLLQQITGSAERALERARAHQQAGQKAVEDELEKIAAFRHRLNHLSHHAPSS